VIADLHHLDAEQDPDSRIRIEMKSWIRIRIKAKSWVRIRIKVKSWVRIRIPIKCGSEVLHTYLCRMCEMFEYSQLLDAALLATNPEDQMALVAAFSIGLPPLHHSHSLLSGDPF
jgi:hypothetical protein